MEPDGTDERKGFPLLRARASGFGIAGEKGHMAKPRSSPVLQIHLMREALF
jgi:hypothetical protein